MAKFPWINKINTHPAFRYSPLYIQRLYHIYQWVILRVTTHIGRFKGISPTDNIFSVVAQQPSSGGFIGLYLSTSWITFKRQTPECHVLCKATVNLQPMLKSESGHYWSFYIIYVNNFISSHLKLLVEPFQHLHIVNKNFHQAPVNMLKRTVSQYSSRHRNLLQLGNASFWIIQKAKKEFKNIP